MTWEVCKFDDRYEIRDEYPYDIIYRSTRQAVPEILDRDGYFRCLGLNGSFLKHKVVATQWVDNPNNYEFVVHVNKNRGDNHIENLRWVSRADQLSLDYEETPEDIIDVDFYNKHEFKDYYYSEEMNTFYQDTGVNMREMTVHYSKSGFAYVKAKNKNNKFISIYFNKFKRQHNIRSID